MDDFIAQPNITTTIPFHVAYYLNTLAVFKMDKVSLSTQQQYRRFELEELRANIISIEVGRCSFFKLMGYCCTRQVLKHTTRWTRSKSQHALC